jgi:Rieske Fe-S protein
MSEQLTRRSALHGVAVVVVGGLAGFAVARNSAAAREKRGTTAANAYGAESGSTSRPLAPVDSIPAGGGKILSSPPVVLVRTGADEVHAFSSICTHQGCPVTEVKDGTILCPCHGSRFDAGTGKVVAGPATSPLPPIPVVVRAGEVYSS